jgi:hypothetical protein
MNLFRYFLFGCIAISVQAGDLDTIGVTTLRQVDPALRGTGVRVAQPEGTSAVDDFEVNPAATGQPSSLFSYYSSSGTTNGFPNAVGTESGHANAVGGNFYGLTTGAAPNVSHVDNYEALFFINNFISPGNSIPARVINQSFAFATNNQATVDPIYDDYAASRNKIFVSVVGNGGPVLPPGTCYNGIAAGAYAFSSAGPTLDGRCKPDVTAPDAAQAPNSANSYSAPYVAGSAAILVQAAVRSDGGADTNAASDLRTVKALLINGAVKPADWTNSTTRPLDARYGAGLVNVFNSWQQLRGGEHSFIESTLVGADNPHPPGANASNEPVLRGWDNNTISTSNTSQDRVNHYYFNLTGTNSYTLTASLVWNKQQNKTAINDLNLFVYRMSNSNLVASSVSTLDNVEHIYIPQLTPGRYDLQVLKRGTGKVSDSETYTLAFEMFYLRLSVTQTNGNLLLTWPVAPTAFNLQSTTSLAPPAAWSPVNATVTVDTNSSLNVVTLPIGMANEYFRLQRP